MKWPGDVTTAIFIRGEQQGIEEQIIIRFIKKHLPARHEKRAQALIQASELLMAKRRCPAAKLMLMTTVRETDGGKEYKEDIMLGLRRHTAYVKCALEWKCDVKANRTSKEAGGSRASRPRSTAPEDTPSFAVPPQTPARGSHARRQSPRSINNLLRAIVISGTRTNPAFRVQSLTSVLFVTAHNSLDNSLRSRILNPNPGFP